MLVLYLASAGWLSFVLGVAVLGLWLRKHPSQANAERSSRVAHLLFFAGLVAPSLVIVFYPGLTHLDELFGVHPLPLRPFFLITGIILALPGAYLLLVSNRLLRAEGSGANAFNLTKHIVEGDIYRYTRNPMSLGYYLLSLAIGFMSGSTVGTAAVILGLVPAHLFFLRFFEELELGLRFGESYRQYRQEVPFLIPGLRLR